jgi:hypothetical protein
MIRFSQAFLLIFLGWYEHASLAQAQLAPTQYYGAYSHAPQGSARAMALGGAYAGLSDDASGLVYNPAGLAHGNWNFDIGSTANTTLNREADINRDDTADGVIFHFDFLALALRLGRFTVAVGQSSPYATEIYSKSSLNQRAGIQILNTDLSLAIAVTEKLSIGLTHHDSKLKESYLTYNEQLFEDGRTGAYSTYGISYRSEKNMGFGFSYTPKTYIDVPSSVNDVTVGGFPTTLSWFKGIALPARYTFGGFFKGSSDLMYIADLDFIHPLENSVLVESPFDGGSTSNQEVKPQLVQIPHGGIEYVVYSQAKKAFIWRVGSYKEPARVVGGKDRFHFTMGVELRLGPLVVSASMDETTGFSNSSQSISIVLGGS